MLIENPDFTHKRELKKLDTELRIGVLIIHAVLAVPLLGLGLMISNPGLKGMILGGAAVASLTGLGRNVLFRMEKWLDSLHP